LSDRPGALVILLSELAELGVNVLDVTHERVAARLPVDEAEVLLHVETRGPDHCDEVLDRLRGSGYTLSFT
jgi:threonine dehydratase